MRLLAIVLLAGTAAAMCDPSSTPGVMAACCHGPVGSSLNCLSVAVMLSLIVKLASHSSCASQTHRGSTAAALTQPMSRAVCSLGIHMTPKLTRLIRSAKQVLVELSRAAVPVLPQ